MEGAALSSKMRTCAVEDRDTSGSRAGSTSEQLQTLSVAVSSLCRERPGLPSSAWGLAQARVPENVAQ